MKISFLVLCLVLSGSVKAYDLGAVEELKELLGEELFETANRPSEPISSSEFEDSETQANPANAQTEEKAAPEEDSNEELDTDDNPIVIDDRSSGLCPACKEATYCCFKNELDKKDRKFSCCQQSNKKNYDFVFKKSKQRMKIDKIGNTATYFLDSFNAGICILDFKTKTAAWGFNDLSTCYMLGNVTNAVDAETFEKELTAAKKNKKLSSVRLSYKISKQQVSPKDRSLLPKGLESRCRSKRIYWLERTGSNSPKATGDKTKFNGKPVESNTNERTKDIKMPSDPKESGKTKDAPKTKEAVKEREEQPEKAVEETQETPKTCKLGCVFFSITSLWRQSSGACVQWNCQ